MGSEHLFLKLQEQKNHKFKGAELELMKSGVRAQLKLTLASQKNINFVFLY